MAFPRLNAVSYWSYLAGGLVMLASWLVGMFLLIISADAPRACERG
jgi:heme/copper-type cytochrome/quinol oxidase subunit 1